MASTDPSVRIIEICKICPPTELATESSLPLTFFDTFSMIYAPNEDIFFYELTCTDSFFSSVLPKLKQSLSLTLVHFLPFAGNLVWPSHSDKPFILYTPGDGISLSVAESTADFHTLSGDSTREAHVSHHYTPELNSWDTRAETMSFQVTFFPHQGFCIGMCYNHAVFDGKSVHMFLSAWAHICRNTGKANGNPTLPPELTPFLDRTVIQDPDGLDMLCLCIAKQAGKDTNPRSLKMIRKKTDPNVVRETFKLSNVDIHKIRQLALIWSETENEAKFSRFVLIYSYVAIAVAKAKGIEPTENWGFVFTADARVPRDPAIPFNYFGNCTTPYYMITEAGRFMKEDGLKFVAEELTKLIKGLNKGALAGMKQVIEMLLVTDPTSVQGIGVAGSPRIDFYGIDFGWGKPTKFELTSIDHGMSFSIVENSGENVIEVGVVLQKHEMDMFRALFSGDFRSRL